jgi:hypothetical protein
VNTVSTFNRATNSFFIQTPEKWDADTGVPEVARRDFSHRSTFQFISHWDFHL